MPAIRVGRARLAHARPGDRERLMRAFDLASPAATGVPEGALLLISNMRVKRPLAAGVEAFADELIGRIRSARAEARTGMGAAGSGFYFESQVAVEAAIVRAAVTGEQMPPLLRRSVACSDAPVTRWRRHLLTDHRLLPRLMAALVETSLAAPWVARFAEDELLVAALRLVRAYGGTITSLEADGSGNLYPASPQGHRGRPVRPARPSKVRRSMSVAEVVAIARAQASGPGARLFLAATLLAARQPALIPTEQFRQALADLASKTSVPRGGNAASGQDPPGRRGPPAAVPAGAASRADAPVRPLRQAMPSFVSAAPLSARPEPQRSRPGADPGMAAADRPLASEAAMTVSSPCAGLFFLLNVFLGLGLYGDFTDPARRLGGLSPFELLLLLGRHWKGRGFESDPVAPLLRSLAGLGARERAGRHFEAPVWKVPPEWVAPWSRARPRAVVARSRISRWHPAGFPVDDRWREPPGADDLRRRWLRCLARYLEARSARALGVESGTEAVATLIERDGTITTAGDRVHVEFALDSHPLAIRLAGLDRDPGWIPSAGHSVLFGFV